MATRVVIFDAMGRARFGCDSGHGDDHAAAWIDDSLALLAEQGITGCTVVEFDPVEGGDAARDIIRSLHMLQLETRVRPDGLREVVGLHRGEPGARGKLQRAAHTVRVLVAPPHLHAPTATIRGKPGALAERARRWRERTHPHHARIARRTGG